MKTFNQFNKINENKPIRVEPDMSVPKEWDLYQFDLDDDDNARNRIMVKRTNKAMTKLSQQFKDDLVIFFDVFENGNLETEDLRKIVLIDKELVEEVIKTWEIKEEDLEDNEWVDQELWEFGDLRIRDSLLKTYFKTIYEVMDQAVGTGATDSEPRAMVWQFAINQLIPYVGDGVTIGLKGHDAQSLVDDTITF